MYFALAAHRLCEVRVAAAIGPDGGPLLELLDAAEIDHSAVAQLAEPTYRWRAEHRPSDSVPVAEEQQLGVYLAWRPRLPDPARRAPVLFLGSMHPGRQLEILAQCPHAQLVALDTMRDFIASHRGELEQLLQRSDIFFATVAELAALIPAGPATAVGLAREALFRWSLQTVVLKLGPDGAVAVSRSASREFPAAPGPPVVDPTGAGDALAGGLLGRLTQMGRSDDDAVDLAMADGSAAARAAISAFGVQGLLTAPA